MVGGLVPVLDVMYVKLITAMVGRLIPHVFVCQIEAIFVQLDWAIVVQPVGTMLEQFSYSLIGRIFVRPD